MPEEMNESKTVDASEKKKRSEWEIKEDVRTIKKFLMIIKDKERFKEAKEMIKENRGVEVSMEAMADGDLKKALGL
jgi:fructose-1,6-bisphosphatase/sedoheptulose 1,7-bisphosphatase-like protein